MAGTAMYCGDCRTQIAIEKAADAEQERHEELYYGKRSDPLGELLGYVLGLAIFGGLGFYFLFR